MWLLNMHRIKNTLNGCSNDFLPCLNRASVEMKYYWIQKKSNKIFLKNTRHVLQMCRLFVLNQTLYFFCDKLPKSKFREIVLMLLWQFIISRTEVPGWNYVCRGALSRKTLQYVKFETGKDQTRGGVFKLTNRPFDKWKNSKCPLAIHYLLPGLDVEYWGVSAVQKVRSGCLINLLFQYIRDVWGIDARFICF